MRKVYRLSDEDDHDIGLYDEEEIIKAIRNDDVCGGDIIRVIIEE